MFLNFYVYLVYINSAALCKSTSILYLLSFGE